jgi:hypothetical protein
LTPNVGSDKIWVWSVVDFSEDEGKLEQFALKFGQVAGNFFFCHCCFYSNVLIYFSGHGVQK